MRACSLTPGACRQPHSTSTCFSLLQLIVDHDLGHLEMTMHHAAQNRLATFPPACRSNFSYQRYTEGRTVLQQFTSKLTDTAVMAVTFDKQVIAKHGNQTDGYSEDTAAAEAGHQRFKNTFVHLVSLMHAVALATLRDDYDMENLVVRVLELHAVRLGMHASQSRVLGKGSYLAVASCMPSSVEHLCGCIGAFAKCMQCRKQDC